MRAFTRLDGHLHMVCFLTNDYFFLTGFRSTKLTGETDPRMLSILVSKLEALHDGVLSAEFVEPELRQALDYYSSIILRANIIFFLRQ